MARIQRIAVGVAVALTALTLGCGGSSSSRKGGSASTTAPTQSNTSAAVVSFRELERGSQSAHAAAPAGQDEFLTLETEADLDPLLSSHQGTQTPTRFNVDWSSERVVALFLGSPASAGLEARITSVAQVDSQSVEVTYTRSLPTQPGTSPAGEPYVFAALANTSGTVSFVDATPAAPTRTPLTDVHGTLISVPFRSAAGETLAFLPDGATDALELVDPTAITSADAGRGSTLTISGTSETNSAGATSLGELARVATFSVDELAMTGVLEPGVNGGVVFRDLAGDTYELIGPEAAAALAQPQGQPLRLTGSVDPAHTSTLTPGPGLSVSSFRATSIVALEVRGGLSGLDERFAVVDLERSGASRYRYSLVIDPFSAKRGRSVLDEAQRAKLEGLVLAADLRSLPDRLNPPPGSPVVADIPLTIVELQDAQGTKRIEVRFGATPPAAFTALLDELNLLRPEVPAFRALNQGAFSQIATAGTRVARDAAELTALWNLHTGGGPGAAAQPAVDWSKEIVVAVFMGSQPTGGYGIEFQRLDGRATSLHAILRRTTPTGATTQVITKPFQFVALERKSANGALWVDGAKLP
jgi:hypothetical protein